MLSSLRAARSEAVRSSSEPYTTSLCSPSSGAGLTVAGESESCTAQPGMVKVPRCGCSTVVIIPRALRCSFSRISPVSTTRPRKNPSGFDLRAFFGPGLDEVVDLVEAFAAGARVRVAGVADQIGATDGRQQLFPHRQRGGDDVDVVVGTSRSAGVEVR